MCRRKPAMQRKHTGFGTKPDDHPQNSKLKRRFMSRNRCVREISPRCKGDRRRQLVNVKEPDQSQKGTCDRIKYIFVSGSDCFFRLRMNHVADRRQCHSLVKKVHCHQISGTCNPHKDSQCHQMASQKARALFIPVHIGKGVKGNQNPYKYYKCRKNNSQIIQIQYDRDVFFQFPDRDRRTFPI